MKSPKSPIVVAVIIVLGLFFIVGCKNTTTNPQANWQPTSEAINARATFDTLPQLMFTYSMEHPEDFPQIHVEASSDSSNLYYSQNLTVTYLDSIIYEATGAEYGHEIQYGYFGGNNTILIISTYRDYYSPVNIQPQNWKLFINGLDTDSLLYQPVLHLTVPPTNYEWQTHSGWYYDGDNPPENYLKELRVPEIRYSTNTQSLVLRFYVRNSYHLTQWHGYYWAEYFPTSNQLLQYGVDRWRWWNEE
jgi:hypothetical protein